MKIRLIGQANHTGIGRHFQEFAHAVKARFPDWSVHLADPYDQADLLGAIATSDTQDVNICFTAHVIPGLKGRMIQWVPFETTRIPDLVREPLILADEIWTMTEWSRSCLIDQGFSADKITVMPQGVDHRFVDAQLTISNPVSFLMVAKYEQRKGISETIQAWAQTLADRTDRLLVIKSHPTSHHQQEFDDLIAQLARAQISNYSVLWGVASDDAMLDLYRSSHVFLAPSYGEGWGRPIMEAAAVGMPIITTRYSAHGEWLEIISDSVRWVDHDLIAVKDQNYDRAYGHSQDLGQWARPRVSSLIDAIRQVDTELPSYHSRARSNSKKIHDVYSWDRVADRVAERLCP